MKRLFALLLCGIMLLSLMPTSALAVDAGPFCPDCGAGGYDSGYDQMEDPTCTEDGSAWVSYCPNCGEKYETIPALGHDWGPLTVGVEPTCTEEGFGNRSCQRPGCGEMERGPIPALGHNWGAWEVVKAPTCTEEGYQERHCQRSGCGAAESQPLPATGHNWSQWATAKEPTCTEDGYNEHHCQNSGCSASETETIPALGHSWGYWYVYREPTPEQPGLELCDCYRGDAQMNREIPYEAPASGNDTTNRPGGDLTAPPDNQSPSHSIDEVSVDKIVTTTPANGEYYVLGEEIGYRVGIQHASMRDDVLLVVGMYDPLISPEWIDMVREPCSGFSRSYTYTVTEADVERGYVENTAIMAWKFVGEETRNELTTNTVTVPTGRDDQDDGDDRGDRGDAVHQNPSISKYATTAPANGEYFVAGETISYAIQVSIPASTAIHNPVVYDRLSSDPLCYLEGIQSAGGSQVVTFEYTVTEEDVKAGYVENIAWLTWKNEIGSGKMLYSDYVLSPTGESGDKQPVAAPNITKTCISTPANGLFYTEGETITFEVTAFNPMNGDLITNITIWDEIANSDAIVYEEQYLDSMTADNSHGFIFTYTVSSSDVAAGYVTNKAGMGYRNADGKYCRTEHVYCTVPTGSEDAYGVKLSKSILSTPANGFGYLPGETVIFQINLLGVGDVTMKNVTVYDQLGGLIPVGHLAQVKPGDTASWVYEYVVTELDAQAGWVYNTASAYGTPEGESSGFWVDSNQVAARTGLDAGFGVISEISLWKAETSSPANGSYYTLGETISYSVTISNTGETDFGECIVYDVLAGSGFEIGSAERLHSSESRTYTVSHTVTAADVAAGYVANRATASCDNNGYGYTAISNTVISDTDGKPDDGLISPGGPGGTPSDDPDGAASDDPNGIPAWTPDSTIPWTPGIYEPTGSFDGPGSIPGQSGPGDYCKCTLTEHNDGYWVYRRDYCGVHGATGKSIDEMLASASSDKAKLDMIELGRQLWEADIDELYEALIQQADTLAKATVMDEKISFYNLVKNTEALLSRIYPDDKVLVGTRILNLLEEHCNLLCYELHTASTTLVDGYTAADVAAAATFGERCQIDRTEEGSSTLSAQTMCDSHAALDSTARILLNNGSTGRAWSSIYSLWFTQLQDSSNDLYESLDSKEKEAVANHYSALIQYAQARENLICALYNCDELTASQAMTQLLRDAVLEACALTEPPTNQTKGFLRGSSS